MTGHNKYVVQEFFRHVSAGEVGAAFALVDDGVAWWVPGTFPFSGTRSKAEYLTVVAAITRGFPNGFTLTPSTMTAEDDRVAVEVESHGEHVNGKTYRNRYHFLFWLTDGRIVAVKEYMDTAHLADLMAG
jgi:ketosteroid isomerase-like protein